jgi:hypothetical protein
VHLLFNGIFLLPALFGDRIIRMEGFGAWFMLLLTNLLFAAPLVLFPIHLWAVSHARKERDHAAACLVLVWMAGAYAAERLITWIVLYIGQRATTGRIWTHILLIFVWIGVVLFVGLLVRYLILLWRTRKMLE